MMNVLFENGVDLSMLRILVRGSDRIVAARGPAGSVSLLILLICRAGMSGIWIRQSLKN